MYSLVSFLGSARELQYSLPLTFARRRKSRVLSRCRDAFPNNRRLPKELTFVVFFGGGCDERWRRRERQASACRLPAVCTRTLYTNMTRLGAQQQPAFIHCTTSGVIGALEEEPCIRTHARRQAARASNKLVTAGKHHIVIVKQRGAIEKEINSAVVEHCSPHFHPTKKNMRIYSNVNDCSYSDEEDHGNTGARATRTCAPAASTTVARNRTR